MQQYDADIILLQEIDKYTIRSGREINQLKRLADRLEMYHVFGKTLDYDGGEYGIGLLSKQKILNHCVYSLPTNQNHEPRALVKASIDTYWGIVRVGVTHFSSESHLSRKLQAEFISLNHTDLEILGGDFNALPESDTINELYENFKQMRNTKNMHTFPSANPIKMIDYILLKKNTNWKVIHQQVINDYQLSDHRAVLIDITK